MCLSGRKLFINQNARFQYLSGNCSKSRASKFQNLRKKHAHNCGNGLELFPVYTAPLRVVNFEVTCLDKPSKPRCRQALYEPGMVC